MASSSSLFKCVSFFLLPTTPSYCESSSSTSNSVSFLINGRRNRYGGWSLRYSNNNLPSPYEMFIDEDEPVESCVTRFRRSVLRAGIIQEAKRRRFHENSQEKQKRKSRDAARRNRRRRTPWSGVRIEDEEALNEEDEKKKKDDEEDNQDNWEYYEGGIPNY